jgi:hypothetical protein
MEKKMSKKESGQLAFRTAYPHDCDDWHEMTPQFRENWANIEAAIRADERAKARLAALEEAAKAICPDLHDFDSEMRSYAEGFAATIRALGSKQDG